MELLVAQQVERHIRGQPLFAAVSLRLVAQDRVGLVGPNGSGKSTLLRTLAGLERLDGGRLWRAPGVRLGFLPQTSTGAEDDVTLWQVAQRALLPVRHLAARLSSDQTISADAYARLEAEFQLLGGYRAEAELRRELASFGFGRADLDLPAATLSAGQRRRLDLATLLASEPDVLLLDEPTNHLDLAARQQLSARLTAWSGALVLISHDRALLDATTSRTAFLEPGGAADAPARLVLEPGGYSTARARRDGSLRASQRARRERQKEAQRLEAMANELASFGRKAQARKRAAQRGRARLLGAMDATVAPAAAPRLATQVAGPMRRHETLLEASRLSVAGVVHANQLTLVRGQRIALLGPNGSGKSTLLDLLSGARRSGDPAAWIRYADGLKLRQLGQVTRGLEDDVPLLQQASARFGTVSAGRLLAEAGVPHSSWSLTPAQLSGGERARAGLALGLAEPADLWLIDEPTNDLDLAAVEALEQQLAAQLRSSGAALVLATHDRRLAERLTNEVWSVVGGEVVRYRDVDAFLAGEVAGGAAPADLTELAMVARDNEPARKVDHGRRIDELEDERSALLRLRDEDAHLTERQQGRLSARLAELEGRLMEAYAATLPPPAPRYRLREQGAIVYGDSLTPTVAGGVRLALVAPQPTPERPTVAATGTGDALAVVATRALGLLAEGAAANVALAGCAAVWLEVRLQDGVGHLQLLQATNACALPWVDSALVDAGARLAFTRLGATVVQLHHRGPLPGVALAAAGDGWWSLGLGQFLQLDGWTK